MARYLTSRRHPETGMLWRIMGDVVPSSDGTEWVPSLLLVEQEGVPFAPEDLEASDVEWAETALVERAHYAETAHGSL